MIRFLLTLTASGFLGAGPQPAPTPTPLPPLPFRVPDEGTIPAGAAGEPIRLGRAIIRETGKYAKGYVGNRLSCTNCHLDAGTRPHAAPFVGITALYPQYRARSGKVDTIEDRINGCFQRSMNGRPLPEDSREMYAIVAYMTWLSQGIPKGREVIGRGFPKVPATRPPDPEKGRLIFARECAACHGRDGQGLATFPPLWGPLSYNIGAGMARQNTAAAFIKANMPFGRGNSLSDEAAHDVAAYINRHVRPDFARKHLDWPLGGKPQDSPY